MGGGRKSTLKCIFVSMRLRETRASGPEGAWSRDSRNLLGRHLHCLVSERQASLLFSLMSSVGWTAILFLRSPTDVGKKAECAR